MRNDNFQRALIVVSWLMLLSVGVAGVVLGFAAAVVLR